MTYEKQKTTCALCGVVLLRKTLLRHIQHKHLLKLSLKCGICDQSFKRLDILKRHEREQHADDNDTVECTHCGKVVKRRVMKSHFESNRCMVARKRLDLSDFEQMTIDTHQKTTHLSSPKHTPEVVDPVVLCIYTFGISLLVATQIDGWEDFDKIIRAAPIYRQAKIELMNTRDRALHSVRTTLHDNSLGEARLIAVFLLLFADGEAFGWDSTEAVAHAKYLDAVHQSARVAPRIARRQFEEIIHHTLRSAQFLIEKIQFNAPDEKTLLLKYVTDDIDDLCGAKECAGYLEKDYCEFVESGFQVSIATW